MLAGLGVDDLGLHGGAAEAHTQELGLGDDVQHRVGVLDVGDGYAEAGDPGARTVHDLVVGSLKPGHDVLVERAGDHLGGVGVDGVGALVGKALHRVDDEALVALDLVVDVAQGIVVLVFLELRIVAQEPVW